jgi:hypothetical protein
MVAERYCRINSSVIAVIQKETGTQIHNGGKRRFSQRCSSVSLKELNPTLQDFAV